MNETQILKTNLNEHYVTKWTLNSDLNKQAQALEVKSQGKQNHITHKPVSTIY